MYPVRCACITCAMFGVETVRAIAMDWPASELIWSACEIRFGRAARFEDEKVCEITCGLTQAFDGLKIYHGPETPRASRPDELDVLDEPHARTAQLISAIRSAVT